MINFITENSVFKTLTTNNNLIEKGYGYKEPNAAQMTFNALISTVALSVFAAAGFATAALGIAFATGAIISTGFTLGNTIGAISGLAFGFLVLTPPTNETEVAPNKETEVVTVPSTSKKAGKKRASGKKKATGKKKQVEGPPQSTQTQTETNGPSLSLNTKKTSLPKSKPTESGLKPLKQESNTDALTSPALARARKNLKKVSKGQEEIAKK